MNRSHLALAALLTVGCGSTSAGPTANSADAAPSTASIEISMLGHFDKPIRVSCPSTSMEPRLVAAGESFRTRLDVAAPAVHACIATDQSGRLLNEDSLTLFTALPGQCFHYQSKIDTDAEEPRVDLGAVDCATPEADPGHFVGDSDELLTANAAAMLELDSVDNDLASRRRPAEPSREWRVAKLGEAGVERHIVMTSYPDGRYQLDISKLKWASKVLRSASYAYLDGRDRSVKLNFDYQADHVVVSINDRSGRAAYTDAYRRRKDLGCCEDFNGVIVAPDYRDRVYFRFSTECETDVAECAGLRRTSDLVPVTLD